MPSNAGLRAAADDLIGGAVARAEELLAGRPCENYWGWGCLAADPSTPAKDRLAAEIIVRAMDAERLAREVRR